MLNFIIHLCFMSTSLSLKLVCGGSVAEWSGAGLEIWKSRVQVPL